VKKLRNSQYAMISHLSFLHRRSVQIHASQRQQHRKNQSVGRDTTDCPLARKIAIELKKGN
jgi:hypothetical protein